MNSPVISRLLQPARLFVRAPRLAIRGFVVAGLLASFVPATAQAYGPNPVEVTVSYASRPGFPGEVYAVVNVRSYYGALIIGDLSVVVNGQVRKFEPIFTSSETRVSLNLGRVDGAVTTCATFGGVADIGDESMVSAQAGDCGQYAPPPRLEPRIGMPRPAPRPWIAR